MEKGNREINKKEFTEICNEIMPDLENIKKVLSEHGLHDTASVSVAADGYLYFMLCGDKRDFRLIRVGDGAARIEESTVLRED